MFVLVVFVGLLAFVGYCWVLFVLGFAYWSKNAGDRFLWQCLVDQ